MGYTFTFGDIERICRSLGWVEIPGRRIWRYAGRDSASRQLSFHSHGAGRPVAPGTAKSMARELGFRTLEEMAEYLKRL